MGGTVKEKSTIELPPWLTDAVRGVIGKGNEIYDTPYKPYTGERVAPLSDLTRGALDRLGDYSAGGDDAAAVDRLMGKAEGAYDAPTTPGGLDAYMNPYVEATLQPTIRHLTEAGDAARMRVGANAQFAGGRGDARHGILESSVNRDQNTAISDATGRAYSDAFTQALQTAGLTGDRFAALGGQTQDQFIKETNALEQGGLIEQQQGQNERDANYEAYLREQEDPYKRLDALIGSVFGAPHGGTTTTEKPDNSWMQILGALFGGLTGFLK